MNRRGLAFLAVPIAGAILLIVAVVAGRGPDIVAVSGAVAPREKALPSRAPMRSAPAASPKEAARSIEDYRLRSTYDNYRVAVATGDTRLQNALHPILIKDRVQALQLAEQDVTYSTDPVGADIARRTLESLRR